MSGLFGAQQVCLRGRGADCQLDPAAEKWMEVTNEQMAGGHCMGFSVTALRFYSGNLSSSDYGADSTFDLEVANNRQLESTIAAGWVYQFLPRVTDQELTGPPNAILQAIVDGLRKDGSNRSEAYSNGGPLYTIKIFNADGGHAITPYRGRRQGRREVRRPRLRQQLPGDHARRRVRHEREHVELQRGDQTRPPRGAVFRRRRPSLQHAARRDASGRDDPAAVRLHELPERGRRIGRSAGSATLYNQISLLGNPSNHAHLLIRDSQGRVTGLVKGKMVNQIPGVQVQQIASIDNWASTPEPNYLIPNDMKAMTVFINGSDLKKPDTETLTLIGQGFYTEVSDLKMTPGQSDGVYFTGDGKGFVYRTAPGHDQSPTVASAIAVGDNAYAFAAKAIGVKGGSQLTMYIDPKLNAFVLDTTGTTPVKSQQGYAAYVLSVVKAAPNGETTWVNGKKAILLQPKSQAIIDYGHLPAANKDVPVYTGASPLELSQAKVQYLQPE